ncbi:MAG: lipoyl synthase [Candidatus Aminicenantes bacterium]|nr:lipoyl synthase [Candidatus Aminicenantes bacterium]
MNARVRKPKPGWLKAKIPAGENYFKIKKELERRQLSTICRDARCPNISECWNNYHATFLIMGDICSRNCSFCAVKTGTPQPLNPEEADRILEMITIMGAKYIVITSVTRDDLADGGSTHFAALIEKIKNRRCDSTVEVLIPGFKGSDDALNRVFSARPDVLNHNLETVKGLYAKVNRNPENYGVSLKVLRQAGENNLITKSGIMIGLGETAAEIEELFRDLRESGVKLLTIGQYLQPGANNLPVEKYYSPEEFVALREQALSCGFAAVESGPFVRSSYGAGRMYRKYRGIEAER